MVLFLEDKIFIVAKCCNNFKKTQHNNPFETAECGG